MQMNNEMQITNRAELHKLLKWVKHGKKSLWKFHSNHVSTYLHTNIYSAQRKNDSSIEIRIKNIVTNEIKKKTEDFSCINSIRMGKFITKKSTITVAITWSRRKKGLKWENDSWLIKLMWIIDIISMGKKKPTTT